LSNIEPQACNFAERPSTPADGGQEHLRGGRKVASVRYIVTDVDSSVQFYRDRLEFKLGMHNPGKFASLDRDDLTLYLSAPGAGSGGTAGGHPEPGGWNRFMLITDDIDGLITRLSDAGAHFKGDISEAAPVAPGFSRIPREIS
jgi:catechol 2,3-dioxygenase-like lactoylglutathione lyase family enzyme